MVPALSWLDSLCRRRVKLVSRLGRSIHLTTRPSPSCFSTCVRGPVSTLSPCGLVHPCSCVCSCLGDALADSGYPRSVNFAIRRDKRSYLTAQPEITSPCLVWLQYRDLSDYSLCGIQPASYQTLYKKRLYQHLLAGTVYPCIRQTSCNETRRNFHAPAQHPFSS